MPLNRDVSSGKLAVKNGFMNEDQVRECLAYIEKVSSTGGTVPSFEDVARMKGYIDEAKSQALSTALRRIEKDSEKKSMSVEGYEILQKIGEGGLSVVYKARQVSMNRIVALKILQKQWLKDEEFKKRFLLEARLVGKLSHENLIKVFDVGKEGWKYYYSMEFIEGETAEDIVEDGGRMDTVRVLTIAIQISKAIDYLKSYNIVHCDIKPGNIMLTKSGVAKLADFGFVKVNIDLSAEEGSVLGTPDYISPEQAMGEDVDFRSDIYSLGASLYHMLAGQPPFYGTSSEVMRAHIKKEPPKLKSLRPELSRETDAVISRMMAKDPEERYQSISRLIDDLNKAMIAEDPDAKEIAAGENTLYDAFKREKFLSRRWEEEKVFITRKLHDYKIFMIISIALLTLSFIVNVILYLKGLD